MQNLPPNRQVAPTFTLPQPDPVKTHPTAMPFINTTLPPMSNTAPQPSQNPSQPPTQQSAPLPPQASTKCSRTNPLATTCQVPPSPPMSAAAHTHPAALHMSGPQPSNHSPASCPPRKAKPTVPIPCPALVTTPTPQALPLLTLNVQGLQTSIIDVDSILTFLAPDVFILTETKLTKNSKKKMTGLLSSCNPNYRQYHSVATHSTDPTAGVAILIHKLFSELGLIAEMPQPAHTQGYLRALQIRLPDSIPLNIVATYSPASAPDSKAIRQAIQDYTNLLVQPANSTTPTTENLIVGGDFNATLFASDRASALTYSRDSAHRQFISSSSLYLLDAPPPLFPLQQSPLQLKKGHCGHPIQPC